MQWSLPYGPQHSQPIVTVHTCNTSCYKTQSSGPERAIVKIVFPRLTQHGWREVSWGIVLNHDRSRPEVTAHQHPDQKIVRANPDQHRWYQRVHECVEDPQ